MVPWFYTDSEVFDAMKHQPTSEDISAKGIQTCWMGCYYSADWNLRRTP
jgi:hypothetical protein